MTEQELIAKFYKSINDPDYPEKSIGWFLSQLPSPIAEQAIANVSNQHRTDKLYDIVNYANFALQLAFVWKDTKEGHLYWQKIREEL